MKENTEQTLASAHQTWLVPMTASRMLEFDSRDSFNHAETHPEQKNKKQNHADFLRHFMASLLPLTVKSSPFTPERSGVDLHLHKS